MLRRPGRHVRALGARQVPRDGRDEFTLYLALWSGLTVTRYRRAIPSPFLGFVMVTAWYGMVRNGWTAVRVCEGPS